MIINSQITKKTSSGGGLLPPEYRQVEYIESTGTQYIDTGYVPNSTDTVEADINYNSSYGSGAICGTCGNYASWVYADSLMLIFAIDSNKRFHCYRYSSEHYITYTGLVDKLVRVVSAPNVFATFSLVDNSTNSKATTMTPRQPVRNIYIFAANGNENVLALSSFKLYRFRITNNSGIPQRDLIPCYRKSDNEIGLYDLVTKTFKTNQGTGTFLKGNDVN